jgi:hypothetical protein
VLVINGEGDPDAEGVAECFRNGRAAALESPHGELLRDRELPRYALSFLKKVAAGEGKG